MSYLNERIRKVRELAGITQETFALSLGVKQGHISKVESGKASPSEQLIKSICREYNVNEKWLKEEKGHIQKDITNLTDEEIQQIEKVIEKGEYRGIKSLLLSCKATLDTLINHTNELKKRTSKNPKAIKLFKVKKILTNKLEELSKTLEIKINSITDEDIITDGFPFFTETEQSLLSILHSLDEHDLKDIYLMLAIKGERLPTTKKDLKKDITILKNASR